MFNRMILSSTCLVLLAACQMLHSAPVAPRAVDGKPLTAVVGTHEGGVYVLPMSLVTITIKQVAGKPDSYYFVDPVVNKVPDPRMLFSLDFSESITSVDSLKVERDEKGFLKKVTLGADDKSTEIIKTLASTVLTLLSGVPVDVGGQQRASEEVATDPIVFQRIIDPTEQTQIEQVNTDIAQFHFKISADQAKERNLGASDLAVEEVKNAGVGGIYYRHPIPYLMQVSKQGAAGVPITAAAYILHLENKSPLIGIDTSRTFFAKKDIILDFAQGQLVDAEVKKESELLNFVSIPFDIANAIVALPAQILQLKIDTTGKEKELVDKNKELIQSQSDLIKTQRDYLDLLKKQQPAVAGSNADGSSGAGGGAGGAADCPPGTTSELCGD